jgi:hypothetical protein
MRRQASDTIFEEEGEMKRIERSWSSRAEKRRECSHADRVLYESMLRGAPTLGLDMFFIPARPGPTPSSRLYSQRSGW